MNRFMRRNYDASRWVAYSNNPDRCCDYCMDGLEDGKCINEDCPKYDHFRECYYPGDDCICKQIQKEREEKAEGDSAESDIDERS